MVVLAATFNGDLNEARQPLDYQRLLAMQQQQQMRQRQWVYPDSQKPENRPEPYIPPREDWQVME
jgi:hypothetical protein